MCLARYTLYVTQKSLKIIQQDAFQEEIQKKQSRQRPLAAADGNAQASQPE
jgi:hypothetical protein